MVRRQRRECPHGPHGEPYPVSWTGDETPAAVASAGPALAELSRVLSALPDPFAAALAALTPLDVTTALGALTPHSAHLLLRPLGLPIVSRGLAQRLCRDVLPRMARSPVVATRHAARHAAADLTAPVLADVIRAALGAELPGAAGRDPAEDWSPALARLAVWAGLVPSVRDARVWAWAATRSWLRAPPVSAAEIAAVAAAARSVTVIATHPPPAGFHRPTPAEPENNPEDHVVTIDVSPATPPPPRSDLPDPTHAARDDFAAALDQGAGASDRILAAVARGAVPADDDLATLARIRPAFEAVAVALTDAGVPPTAPTLSGVDAALAEVALRTADVPARRQLDLLPGLIAPAGEPSLAEALVGVRDRVDVLLARVAWSDGDRDEAAALGALAELVDVGTTASSRPEDIFGLQARVLRTLPDLALLVVNANRLETVAVEFEIAEGEIVEASAVAPEALEPETVEQETVEQETVEPTQPEPTLLEAAPEAEPAPVDSVTAVDVAGEPDQVDDASPPAVPATTEPAPTDSERRDLETADAESADLETADLESLESAGSPIAEMDPELAASSLDGSAPLEPEPVEPESVAALSNGIGTAEFPISDAVAPTVVDSPEASSPEADSPEIDSPEASSPEADSPEDEGSAVNGLTLGDSADGELHDDGQDNDEDDDGLDDPGPGDGGPGWGGPDPREPGPVLPGPSGESIAVESIAAEPAGAPVVTIDPRQHDLWVAPRPATPGWPPANGVVPPDPYPTEAPPPATPFDADSGDTGGSAGHFPPPSRAAPGGAGQPGADLHSTDPSDPDRYVTAPEGGTSPTGRVRPVWVAPTGGPTDLPDLAELPDVPALPDPSELPRLADRVRTALATARVRGELTPVRDGALASLLADAERERAAPHPDPESARTKLTWAADLIIRYRGAADDPATPAGGDAAPVEPPDAREFFPAVALSLPGGITPELIGAARGRRRYRDLDALDFTGLSPERADAVADALTAWRAAAVASGPDPGHPADGLTGPLLAVLRLIGLAELIGPAAPVLVHGRPGAATLASLAERHPDGAGRLILHVGTMTAATRRELGALALQGPAPLLVLDDAALAFLAARGDGRGVAALATLLPFSGMNPYAPRSPAEDLLARALRDSPTAGTPAKGRMLTGRRQAELVVGPLLAAGYAFGDDELAGEFLGLCGYDEARTFRYAKLLVDRMADRRRAGIAGDGPPWQITRAAVAAVAADAGALARTAADLRARLAPDPRLAVVADVLGEQAHIAGLVARYADGELLRRCQDRWSRGFAAADAEELRALARELVTLGIAAPNDDRLGWRLRGPDIRAALGTLDDISRRLAARGEQDPAGAPGTRVTPPAHAAPRDRLASGRRSPLTTVQLDDVLGAGAEQVRVVLGSTATGIGDASAAIRDAARTAGHTLASPMTAGSQAHGTGARAFDDALVTGQPGQHRVVLGDLTIPGLDDDAADRALVSALRPRPARYGVTRSAVLVAGPNQLPLWREVLAALPTSAGLGVVSPRRYDAANLPSRWDTDEPFGADGRREDLLAVTGGWPLLVERAVAYADRTGETSALARLERHLATADGAADLVDAVGLTRDDTLAEFFDALTDGPWGFTESDLAAAAAAVGGWVGGQPAVAVACLHAMRVFDVDDDGLRRPEPLLVECWKHRRIP
jgi:hypothetical protein